MILLADWIVIHSDVEERLWRVITLQQWRNHKVESDSDNPDTGTGAEDPMPKRNKHEATTEEPRNPVPQRYATKWYRVSGLTFCSKDLGTPELAPTSPSWSPVDNVLPPFRLLDQNTSASPAYLASKAVADQQHQLLSAGRTTELAFDILEDHGIRAEDTHFGRGRTSSGLADIDLASNQLIKFPGNSVNMESFRTPSPSSQSPCITSSPAEVPSSTARNVLNMIFNIPSTTSPALNREENLSEMGEIQCTSHSLYSSTCELSSPVKACTDKYSR